MQDRQPLDLEFVGQDHDPGHISSRPRVACGEPKFSWVSAESDDRNRACRRGGGRYRVAGNGDDRVRLGGEQLAHQTRQQIRFADTRVEGEIAAFNEAKPCKFRQSYLAGKRLRSSLNRKMPEAIDTVRRLGANGKVGMLPYRPDRQ